LYSAIYKSRPVALTKYVLEKSTMLRWRFTISLKQNTTNLKTFYVKTLLINRSFLVMVLFMMGFFLLLSLQYGMLYCGEYRPSKERNS